MKTRNMQCLEMSVNQYSIKENRKTNNDDEIFYDFDENTITNVEVNEKEY